MDTIQENKLISQLGKSILSYIDEYKRLHNSNIKDYHNSYPNPNNLDPITTFKNVCNYNLTLGNSDEFIYMDGKTYYRPDNMFYHLDETDVSGMIFIMDEDQDADKTPKLIAVAKYTVKDISTYDSDIIYSKFGGNNKVLYIDVRCVSPAVRRRKISEFLIALILFNHLISNGKTKIEIAGVIGSMNASAVEEVEINNILHSKHMKAYAGCRINEYRPYYYQNISIATDMVIKCLSGQCTYSDWEHYCL